MIDKDDIERKDFSIALHVTVDKLIFLVNALVSGDRGCLMSRAF